MPTHTLYYHSYLYITPILHPPDLYSVLSLFMRPPGSLRIALVPFTSCSSFLHPRGHRGLQICACPVMLCGYTENVLLITDISFHQHRGISYHFLLLLLISVLCNV